MTSDKIIIVALLIVSTVLTTGCFEEYHKPALDTISPIIVLKGSTQYCVQYPEGCANESVEVSTVVVDEITPEPTPTPLPTITTLPTPEFRNVPQYNTGERWEGQWFKFKRDDVLGLKDMDVGVVVYRHAYMDKYTWWNHATGNYQTEYAPTGMRYVTVWIHEEMFGENQTSDPRIWAFDNNSFALQYKDSFLPRDMEYNAVNNILDFQYKYDYYNVVQARPFGYDWIYTGRNAETGGWDAQKIGWLRMGRGNAIDGYIIFLAPKEVRDEDLILVGSFSTFGSAYWRFDVESSRRPPLHPIPPTPQIVIKRDKL